MERRDKATQTTTPDEPFDAILTYMEDELSFATSHYNEDYLDRRISSRIRRTGSDGYDDYYDVLQSDPDEQEAVLEAMSINVTGFFRNPEVWSGIRDVLRELTAERRTVRIWSAPCADGREPYSLSMLAHDDPDIDDSAIRILGTDISDPALETAREGVYESSRTTDIADQLSFLDDPSDYIEEDNDTFRITEPIKRPVTFERHDLINDRPRSGFELVLCRNLFIYIDSEYKRPILEMFADGLETDGYLVIGKAETLPRDLQSTFASHDSTLRIYRRE
ncbi:CheR family methyltransferase [Halobiforma nitratireducens]|uniref:protein-glutamate O-methyltransferase n=1 Tax=Halobiforma nitratireducens JCM 10879 TaxID=1227454 RepID=M0MIF5_9EURY|nr:protein-glutamate O-methyltransferase CheR [Halobiforma nitratireducens]EMA45133.1 chemotaxis protein CheR [Halobiforma nitratireducens JCM 10879]